MYGVLFKGPLLHTVADIATEEIFSCFFFQLITIFSCKRGFASALKNCVNFLIMFLEYFLLHVLPLKNLLDPGMRSLTGSILLSLFAIRFEISDQIIQS